MGPADRVRWRKSLTTASTTIAIFSLDDLLPLIRFRLRYRMHKGRQFFGIELAVMIPIGTRELHFQEPEYLVFGDRLGCRNRSHIVLNCHEDLRPQKGPSETRANHTIAVSWKSIITPPRMDFTAP
jgi:hypothetical protein